MKVECPELNDTIMRVITNKLLNENSTYQEVCDFLDVYYNIHLTPSEFKKCYPKLKVEFLKKKNEENFTPSPEKEEEKREKLRQGILAEDIVEWMQANIKVMSKHDGGVIPYTYYGREFYIPIHRSYLDAKRDVMILKSRQVEASTSFIDVMFYLLTTVPSFTVAHVFPSEIKAGRFSAEKINEFLFYNPKFGEMIAKDVAHNQFDKAIYSGEGDSGGLSWYRMSYIGGKKAKSEDIRSMSVDLLGIDEYDDFPPQSMGALVGSTLHSPFGKRIYLFTPKLPTSPAYQHWEQTTQNEFYYVCKKCGTPNILDINHIKEVKGKYEYVCESCGEIIDKKIGTYRDENGLLQIDKTTGFWKPKKPDGIIDGYHITQMMFPYITAEDIMKYKNDPNITKREFFNEILGEPYAGEEMPLTYGAIMKCVDDDVVFGVKPKGTVKTVMGVDWGASSHYVKVAKLYNGALVLYEWGAIYGTTDEHFTFVRDQLEKDNTLICVVDRGYDIGRTARLQSVYGDRVWGVTYGGADKLITWEKDRYNKSTVIDYKITINHTRMVDNVLEMIKNGEITISGQSEIKAKVRSLVDNMSLITYNIVVSRQDRIEVQKVTYDTQRGHYFMSLLYSLLPLRFFAEDERPLAYIKGKNNNLEELVGNETRRANIFSLTNSDKKSGYAERRSKLLRRRW